MDSTDRGAGHYYWKQMLDAATVTRIREIADDRTSGAAELALRAAEVLSFARTEDLAEAASAVMNAQPAMASVYNAAQACLVRHFKSSLTYSGDGVRRRRDWRLGTSRGRRPGHCA